MKYTIRNVVAFFIAQSFIKLGFVRKSVKKTLNNKNIISVFCHDPSKKFFTSNIKWLNKMGYHFISIDELKSIALNHTPFPTGAVIVTVDDGWKDNLKNIVPISTKYNIPVTFFVSTDPVENGNAFWWSYFFSAKKNGLTSYSLNELKRFDDANRIKEIDSFKSKIFLNRESITVNELQDLSNSKLISIQSHTVTHPILTNCSDKKSWFEINESKHIIENWTKKNVFAFSYPNGNFSKREMQFLEESGYQLAFTTRDSFITPENIKDKFTLPRVDLIENISFSENICRISGVWFDKKKWLFKIFSK